MGIDAKIRLSVDRFCRFCRSIVILLTKKAVKYGPLRRICSRFIMSPTGSWVNADSVVVEKSGGQLQVSNSERFILVYPRLRLNQSI